jgi:ubiquinone/menaquinone biosynthesis C-methylase UbiE
MINNKTEEIKDYDGYYKYDNLVSTNYDESRQSERHWIEENKFIEDYINKQQINNLLEIPVGTGRFLQYYTKNIISVTGIDVSEDMLNEARKKLSSLRPQCSVSLEQGDIFNLRFQDNNFDTTIVFRLFHLMPEESVAQAVKELCRVTSRDIVVQSYVPVIQNQGKESISVITRIIAKFTRVIKSFLKKEDEVSSIKSDEKPWFHIQAYYHSQSFLDLEFSKYNFHPHTSQILSIYGDSEVRVSVYSEKNQTSIFSK